MRIFCEKNGPNLSDFEVKIKMKLPDFYNRVPVVKKYIKVLILFYYHIWSIAKFWLNLFVNASLVILREPYSDSVPGWIYELLRDFATLINLPFSIFFFFNFFLILVTQGFLSWGLYHFCSNLLASLRASPHKTSIQTLQVFTLVSPPPPFL